MSAKATFWAWEAQGLKSTEKFVLVCIADNHNADTDRCNPSAKYISEKTGLNIKTVKSALQRLEDQGVISIDHRAGKSSNFRLNLDGNPAQKRADPKTDLPQSDPTQKRADPKTGRPKNGSTQNRDRGRPKNGSGVDPNLGPEPKKNLKPESKNNYLSGLDFSSWPEIPSEQVWADYKKLRQAKRAPITQTLIDQLAPKLRELWAEGITPDAAIAHCVARGWQGLEVEWVCNALARRLKNNADDFVRRHTDKGWAAELYHHD